MKIGIHHNPGSFSDRWIEYCRQKNIDFKLVDCYKNDIINQLDDCDVFMWHHNHLNYKDLIFAKQLLFSIEATGKKVFPNYDTNWYFDDKIAQKYLFETLNIPHPDTYIFYSKKEALKWINEATFPKIFKLRCGAGSLNVKIVKSKKTAVNYTKQAFGKGFYVFSRFNYLIDVIQYYKIGKTNFSSVLRSLVRLVVPSNNTRMLNKEKGYVYFQELIDTKGFDIRVVVVGEKAFAIKRNVRTNDFRASGSGNIIFETNEIPISAIKLAFASADKLHTQCTAFDIVIDKDEKSLVLEISYGFAVLPYDNCLGYWDKDLNFHSDHINPQAWMLESLI